MVLLGNDSYWGGATSVWCCTIDECKGKRRMRVRLCVCVAGLSCPLVTTLATSHTGFIFTPLLAAVCSTLNAVLRREPFTCSRMIGLLL